MVRSGGSLAASIASWSGILLSLYHFHHESEAFVVQQQHQQLLSPRYGPSVSYDLCFGSETTKPLMAKPNDEDADDDDFYRDLRRAKAKKLGGSIPPEQARASVAQAEADFLRAMRETTKEFEKNKAELGSDGAIDIFLDLIREEDEKREYDDDDYDEDDDYE